MDTKICSSAIFLLAINLLFFTLASGCYTCGQPNIPNPNPNPNPRPSGSPPTKKSCPRDALKLGVCAKVLNGTVAGVVVGKPPDTQCCSVLGGLVDLEAAVCLCTAIKANVLGINIDIPIALSILINTCGKNLPSDFICA